MGLVMVLLGCGLAFAAWRTDDKAVRWIWIVFAVLNLGGAAAMIGSGDPRAFHLSPARDGGDTGFYRD
jgi:hypothetical protein